MAPSDRLPFDQQQLRPVDPAVWKTCAGAAVKIPHVNSRVYYFPQGHLEHSSNPHSSIPSTLLSSLPRPFVSCRLTHVLYSSDPNTEEVFVVLRLEPVKNDFYLVDPTPPFPPPPQFSAGDGGDVGGRLAGSSSAAEDVVSFAKVLTSSDANNGGGFSVPRFCADKIFPPLDYDADPPVQTLTITDVRGESWNFRHIYRGTPRRHLLTTGWSKFVNSKKLIAGDSVVFISNRATEKLFVGVRRAQKSSSSPPAISVAASSSGGGKVEECGDSGFSRNGKGKVSLQSVMEAVELASKNMPFEVVYYPKAGSPDFVVGAGEVEAALRMYWAAGMRVKMSMETEDSQRMSWVQGTVSSVVLPEAGVWQRSPWRMIQVAWDEPDVLQNLNTVNPWQVEYVAPTPPIHTAFPSAKRFRVTPNSGPLADGAADFTIPLMTFSNSFNGQFSPFFKYTDIPVGMQGARQDYLSISSIASILSNGNRPFYPVGYSETNQNQYQKVEDVSTELNIGSSHSGTISPDSPSSILGSSNDGQRAASPAQRADMGSFQLFGKTIQVGCRGAVSNEVGKSKGPNHNC